MSIPGMIHFMGLFLLVAMPDLVYGQSQAECFDEFVRFTGEPGVDEGASCVIEASQGGLYLAGYREDDALVLHADYSGNVDWSMRFQITPFADRVISLYETEDQFLIGVGAGLIANSDNRAFAFKIDPASQTLLWTTYLDGASAFYDIHEILGSDELIITGVNDIDANLYMVKMDSGTGNVLSTRTFVYAGEDDDYISSVVHKNALYAAGRQTETPGTVGNMKGTLTKMDLDGNILFNKIYLSPLGVTSRIYSFDLVIQNDEIGMCHWYNPTSSAAQFSCVWTRSDLDGKLLQAEEYTFQGYSDIRPENIYFWNGHYYIFGYTNAPTKDLFLLQLDVNGMVKWAKKYGGNGQDDLFILARSKPVLFSNDELFIVGQSTSNNTGGTDIFFLRVNENGALTSPCMFAEDLQVNRTTIQNPPETSAPLQEIQFPLTPKQVNPVVSSVQFGVEVVLCSVPCSEDCTNGIDDDGDGLIDCLDPDCCGSLSCPVDTLLEFGICTGDTLFIMDTLITSPGVYCFDFINVAGCDSTVCIDLKMNGLLVVQDVLIQPTCPMPNGGQIQVSISGGQSPFTYQWLPVNLNSPMISGLTGGNYGLTVTDATGCTGIQSFSLVSIVMPGCELTIASPKCFGQPGTVSVIPTMGTPPFMFYYDGGLSFQTASTVELLAGTYLFSIKDATGCQKDTSFTISQPPPLFLQVGQDTFTAGAGEVINLLASAAGGVPPYTFNWTPPLGLTCSNCPDPSVLIGQVMSYTVTLIDSNGCSRSLSIAIDVTIDKSIYVPNAFTPNQDGINDLFQVFGTGVGVQEVERLQVWDRWGELLFEDTHFQLNDPNIGWDGFWRGKLMDPAVFVYVVDVLFIDGDKRTYKGDFTLVR